MPKLKLILLAVVLSLAVSGFAQSVASGDLLITVKDPSGKVITNATVTAKDQAKGLERAGVGDNQGDYRVSTLPPGNYVIAVEAT